MEGDIKYAKWEYCVHPFILVTDSTSHYYHCSEKLLSVQKGLQAFPHGCSFKRGFRKNFSMQRFIFIEK
ncbi:hypothetical protein UP17_04540 [Peribacillus simplex]|nr:hypothetical protein UP17_04540 [Peribacillus simplex]